jgi:hypothetical protein
MKRSGAPVFEITKEVDPQGYCVLRNHHLVVLRRSGVASSTMPDRYKHDTVFDLSAQRTGDLLKVVFDLVADQSGVRPPRLKRGL